MGENEFFIIYRARTLNEKAKKIIHFFTLCEKYETHDRRINDFSKTNILQFRLHKKYMFSDISSL